MADDHIPEPDCADGAPHPRMTEHLLGQSSAEADFLDAFNSDRLHHAWMITGPRGVGKATLAWRIARFMLTQADTDDGGMFASEPTPPDTLDTDPNHPVLRRMAALAEPRMFLCRRGWNEKTKKLKSQLTVDEVRKLKGFFTHSATEGGWRVALVDAADELNVNAANALLKILEEPPARTLILLICHQPARLLPTIRSRCRELRCDPLTGADQAAALAHAGVEDAGDMASVLASLSSGSVGEALRLAHNDGPAIYAKLVGLAGNAPGMDREAANALAAKCVGAANVETYDITVRLIDLLLNRLARFGALQPAVWDEAAPHEARILAQLAPHAQAARKWAALAQNLTARASHARAVNLDPSGVILDMLLQLDETARR